MMRRSSGWVVAIWAGFVPALLAQSGSWYSEAEAERRLAHIQEVAASSGGKIEITVIRLPGETAATVPAPLAETAEPAAPGVPWGAEFTPLPNPDAEWQEQFDRALALETEKSWREALKVLLHLSDNHPDHPRRGECYYEMGECLAALGNYPMARRAFCQVLQYPASTVYDDALMRVAAALIREGRAGMAHPYLERLLATLPNSEFAPLAEELLRTI